MIREHLGQFNSHRTQREELELLLKDIGTMSEEELRLFEIFIQQASDGDTELMEETAATTFKHQPVSMEQFLDDDYYLGQTTRDLFPALRDDLIEIYDDGPYREVVMGGALGVGKSYLMSYGITRLLYEASCLHDPQQVYGLAKGSDLFIILVTKTLNLAKDVMKSKVDSLVYRSPYFMEHFRPRFKELSTEFPKNIKLVCGSIRSAGNRITGRDVIGGAMDESNLMSDLKAKKVVQDGKRRVVKTDVAEELYSEIKNRIKSRGSHIPGIMFLVSSKTVHDAFLDRHVRRNITDPLLFIRERASWDVYPPGDDRHFRVLVGGAALPSRILMKGEKDPDDDELGKHNAFVISVPEEFRSHFELDLDRAIRDMAGRSTASISAYIYRTHKVDECIDADRAHPFSCIEWDFDSKNEGFVWERLCNQIQHKLPGGYSEIGHRPKINPNAPRCVHFDQSLSGDSFGVAMGHIDKWVEIVRRDDQSEQYTDLVPRFIIDFVLRINPPHTGDIRLAEVRWLIYDLIQHGFQVFRFTTDSFQSADALQSMRDRGIRADLLSVDRKPDAYEALKNAIYDSRISYYKYPPLIDELKTLQRDVITGKIDHPKGGTKDTSDSVAGVVFSLQQLARTMQPTMDSSYTADFVVNQGDIDDDFSWVLESNSRPVRKQDYTTAPDFNQQGGRMPSADDAFIIG